MAGLIEAGFGVLDRRLFVTTFLPVLAFLAGLGTVIASGLGWHNALGWWSGLNTETRVVGTVAVLLVTLLLTQMLTAGRPTLIRLYEGYWQGLPGGPSLADRRARRQRDLYQALAKEDPRRLAYPADDDQIMPTTLGNLLRGAEEHSKDRYCIVAVMAWPRLYSVLPDSFRQVFASAAMDMELAVTASALGAAFALAGGALSVVLLPWPAVLLCGSAGVLTAWIGYRAAVRAAGPYAQLVRSAFDVYRWSLLDSMGLTHPTSIPAELNQWRALDELWAQGSVSTDHAAYLGYPAAVTPDAGQASSPGPRLARVPSSASDRQIGNASPERPFPIRAVLVSLLVVVVVGSAIVLGASIHPLSSPRAVHDLPAYHRIIPGDVTGPGSDRLRGHYTLRERSAGTPIRTADLGPVIRVGELAGRDAVSVGSPALAAPPPLAPGTIVTIIVATADSRAPTLILGGVLVLDVGNAIVVAVPRDKVAALVTAERGGTVHIVIELR